MNDSGRFIQKAREKHGNRFDYTMVRYWSRGTPVEITCKAHGRFHVSPKRHLSTKAGGCERCNRFYYSTNSEYIKVEKPAKVYPKVTRGY